MARLFIWLGFWVRRGREIYTIAALDRATDLDVLAIRYSQPFRRDVQIVECKSEGDRPLDRIFWLSGVQKYVSADRATLIRKSTKWNIKDFAKAAGVEILDHPRLDELEQNAGVDTSVWPGISDREYFFQAEAEWNKTLHREESLTELCLTLGGEVRYQDPFGGINYLLHHARALTRSLKERRISPDSLGKFLLSEVISQLAMFLMRIAESSFGLSVTDRFGLIRKGLTYGEMNPKLTDRIFRNAHRIATETLRHYGRTEVRLDESLFKMPEPPNIQAVHDVVELLLHQPRGSTTFGPLTDLIVFEAFLKSRDISCLRTIFGYSNLEERLDIVRRFIRILNQMGSVPDDLVLAVEAGLKNSPSNGSPSEKAEGIRGSAADSTLPIKGKTEALPLFGVGREPGKGEK